MGFKQFLYLFSEIVLEVKWIVITFYYTAENHGILHFDKLNF